MKVLVISSFFPSSHDDELPQFLLDQALAFALNFPDDEFVYLAASRANRTLTNIKLPSNLSIERFNYFSPRRYQLLTEYGILSTVKKYPLTLFTVPFLFFFEYLAIRKSVKQHAPDLIYSHWMLPQGLLAHSVADKHGIPHVLTSHSSDIEIMFRFGSLGKRIALSIISSLKAMNVVSSRGLEFLKSQLPPSVFQDISNKLSVLPMGVPDSLLDEIRMCRERLCEEAPPSFIFSATSTPNLTSLAAGTGAARAGLQEKHTS